MHRKPWMIYFYALAALFAAGSIFFLLRDHFAIAGVTFLSCVVFAVEATRRRRTRPTSDHDAHGHDADEEQQT